MVPMDQILVIGGTGTVGRQVLAQLPSAAVRVRAMVRNPQAARVPPHVDLVRGDLTAVDTLDAALDGIDTVFLVWCAPPSAVSAALERIVSRARRIVLLTSPHKTQHPFFQGGQPNPLAAMHAEIENRIETSGREWTFLRPHIFAANALNWWAPQIRAGATVIRWPYIAAPAAPIDEQDIAAVAVRALCESGHAGAEYLLTGPQAVTQAEQIVTIGDVIGRPLRIEEISPESAPAELLPIFPPTVVKMLLGSWSAAIGHPALVTSTVAEITGTPAHTFREWAAHHAAEFQSRP